METVYNGYGTAFGRFNHFINMAAKRSTETIAGTLSHGETTFNRR